MTLVERLRRRKTASARQDLCDEAADRIEQLETELDGAQQSATFYADESMCRKATIEQLEAEIHRLHQIEEALIAWQTKGEKLFLSSRCYMFNLGEWWADRPWRKR